MSSLARRIDTMSPAAVEHVRRLETEAAKQPQVHAETQHAFHAGMYARTLIAPAGLAITGALVRVPTILIISGDVLMYGEDGVSQLTGYNVMLGAAGRKQAFVTLTDTHMTMLYPTEAKTVEDAEAEFTAEADLLLSRRPPIPSITATED